MRSPLVNDPGGFAVCQCELFQGSEHLGPIILV
jgi:hypothetical protein